MVADKLQCLDSFLLEHLSRRQQRGYSNGGGGGRSHSPGRTGLMGVVPGGGSSSAFFGAEGDGGAGGQAAKRQRLSQAAGLEDERTARMRWVGVTCEWAAPVVCVIKCTMFGCTRCSGDVISSSPIKFDFNRLPTTFQPTPTHPLWPYAVRWCPRHQRR